MPRLEDSMAKKVSEQESTATSREPLEPGEYTARLRSVTPKTASTGNPMWTAEWEVTDEPYVGRYLWSNLVFVDTALWKVKEFFDAFGVDSKTHTDELLGRSVKLVVSQRVIQSGAKQGQIGNNIDLTLPLEGTEPAAAAVGAGVSKANPAEF